MKRYFLISLPIIFLAVIIQLWMPDLGREMYHSRILIFRGIGNTDHRFLFQILNSSILSTAFAPLLLTGLKFLHRVCDPWGKANLEGFEHFIRKHQQ